MNEADILYIADVCQIPLSVVQELDFRGELDQRLEEELGVSATTMLKQRDDLHKIYRMGKYR